MLGVGGSEWSSIYGVDGRGFRKACPSVVVACSGSRVNFATQGSGISFMLVSCIWAWML